MEWLANLGKDNKIIYVEKNKTYTKSQYAVKEYKADYYIKNINKYRERNRIASQKRTEERIKKLSDDEKIYKLDYILNN
jgi:hypothetical protein